MSTSPLEEEDLQGKTPAVPVIPSFRCEPASCNWRGFLSDALPVFGSVNCGGWGAGCRGGCWRRDPRVDGRCHLVRESWVAV